MGIGEWMWGFFAGTGEKIVLTQVTPPATQGKGTLTPDQLKTRERLLRS